ncbi:LysR family transcriptional regulator [Paraburkholderia sp.]|uniref:LysR family transcriptional regulator n=1 Tax=Paraburkholderia sp. TaxID=1926495 RepID=UPI002394AB05|nr:LysR family transcriptional regulator [Paraburkholderia sp.]MDE1182340.1 LysR family transcriptional regulator [Paraburkholderia sp.]
MTARFSLDQLEAFVAAAQERSFSGAARKLGKAQSAVSTAVINLEVDLGVILFDRSGRYPTLTEAGDALLREAQSVVAHCAALQDRANGLNMRVEPKLAIAVDDAIPYAAIAATLRGFEAAFPDLELDMRHPSHDDILQLTARGDVKLGMSFAQPAYPKQIAFCRLGTLTFTNAVHRDHPLAQVQDVSFAQLGDYRQIVVAPHGRTLPTGEYLKSPRCWNVESYMALLEMAKDGLGWVSLPKRLIRAELESGQLVELKLAAYPFTEWSVGIDLIWSTEQESGRAANWLRGELSRHPIDA